MHDTVADDNVLRPDLRPFFATKFGDEPSADRAVVILALARWRALCRRERADEVGPADNADDFAIARHWHAFEEFAAIPSLNKTMVLELARCEYVARRENVIAVGNSGTGNTILLLDWGWRPARRACRSASSRPPLWSMS